MAEEYKNEQVRKIQLKELEMLHEMIKICEKHHLRYYASGGTLLGAIRHKGFIPWDDDIDIMMPRKDYEQFMKLAPDELPANQEIYNFRENNKKTSYFMQILDLDTELIGHWSNIPQKLHVWLDIFPLDGMPSGALRQKFHKFHLLFAKMLLQFSCFDENVNQFKANRSLMEKVAIRFCSITHIGRLMNPRKRMEYLDRVLKKYPYDSSDLVVNFNGAYKFREMFPREYCELERYQPFEDISIRIPEQSEKILEQLYGDYMVIPPLDEVGKQHRIEIVKL